jgi:glycosyltransferase involved in cell wall biosynthesis
MATAPDVPVVTLITACRDAGRFIGRLLDSVAGQTVSAWEHIVIDDGSGDDSAAIVQSYAARDRRVRLERQPPRGVAAARNAGFRLASPRVPYVYFLDADDCLEPRMLETMTQYLDAHPAVGLAYCDAIWIDENDRPLDAPSFPRYVPSGWWVRPLGAAESETPFVSVYCWAPVMESCSVIRRSVYETTPGWDEALGQGGEGVDLFLHIALRSSIHRVPEALYRYRRHAAQHSADWGRHERQARAIEAKWDRLPNLAPAERALVRSAYRFRHGRLRAAEMTGAATRYLSRGHVRDAAVCAREAARAWAGEMLWR